MMDFSLLFNFISQIKDYYAQKAYTFNFRIIRNILVKYLLEQGNTL